MQLPPTILSIDQKLKSSPSKTAGTTLKPTKKETGSKRLLTETLPPDRASQSDVESDCLEDSSISLISNEAKKSLLVPPETLETTLFDRLEDMYGSGIKRMLTVQYR